MDNDSDLVTLDSSYQFFEGYDDVIQLADTLLMNPTLTTLRSLGLNSNQIGDEGARTLAKALEVNESLTNLSLSSNDIGVEGARALTGVNLTLTNLSLSSNDIGFLGTRALADALKLNRTLTSLDLSSSHLW